MWTRKVLEHYLYTNNGKNPNHRPIFADLCLTVVPDPPVVRLREGKDKRIIQCQGSWNNSTNNNINSNNYHTINRVNITTNFLEILVLFIIQYLWLCFCFIIPVLNDSSTSNDSYRMSFTSSRSQLLNASDLMNNVAISEVGHSNPNFVSNVSLDRPPSARSSYSNYHGVRTLAFNKQATPQVPSNSIRRNTRSAYSTFLNDGPPAYEIQGAVNSETVI